MHIFRPTVRCVSIDKLHHTSPYIHYSVTLTYIHIVHSEGHDRNSIGLPGKQDQLLTTIKGNISSSTKMIVVLMSGGPVDITTAKVPNLL